MAFLRSRMAICRDARASEAVPGAGRTGLYAGLIDGHGAPVGVDL
ncbi:MAG: hypothetical protein AAGB07_20055 [Pseudomonadota bacterium]